MTISYLDPKTKEPTTIALNIPIVNIQSILKELNRMHNVTKYNEVHLNVSNDSMTHLELFSYLNISLHYN